MITLDEAQKFIAWLEPQLAFYPNESVGDRFKVKGVMAHCAIAGSVAYRGYSENDLDVIIYPHNDEPPALPSHIEARLKEIFDRVIDANCDYEFNARTVLRTHQYGWKIDFFLLR